MFRLGAVLAICVGLIAYGIFGDRLPFGPLAATPFVTPAPTPKGPPATPAPTPTPEAWRLDAAHPANAFAALMTSSDVTYHIETKVTASYLTNQAVLGEKWDIAGPDLSYSITVNEPSGVTTNKAIRKGDALYVKRGGRPWIEQHVFDWWDIFGASTTDAYGRLTFVGQELRDGRPSYHVVLPVAGFPFVSSEELLITGAPPVSSWDVWVDEAGQPLAAWMHAGFNGVVQRRSIPVQMTFEYTFSKVGDPVKIEVPAAFR